jgi:hypothetical protein
MKPVDVREVLFKFSKRQSLDSYYACCCCGECAPRDCDEEKKGIPVCFVVSLLFICGLITGAAFTIMRALDEGYKFEKSVEMNAINASYPIGDAIPRLGYSLLGSVIMAPCIVGIYFCLRRFHAFRALMLDVILLPFTTLHYIALRLLKFLSYHSCLFKTHCIASPRGNSST